MYKELIDRLESTNELSFSEYLTLIKNRAVIADYAAQRAAEVRNRIYGNRVFIRGLIEISSYCKNDCLYCGLRCSNKNAERYRLTKEQILSCADEGYALGFRTFVLQGGEDGYFTDELLTDTISEIKRRYPDTAVTLSLGERSYESYKTLKQAGADRYLLRHETADNTHYARLHPNGMSFENRQECIKNLKKLGYQVGVGFMVGSPYQTEENLANELLYLKEIQPQMVGIGPFITHKDTPFNDFENGSAELTLFLLSLIRLTLP
ncbi:MAG: [Eubacterium sp.]|nr:[FeFe] hydrogenase H-cluster radical SAM maturase HydE [Eubacterium sp.]